MSFERRGPRPDRGGGGNRRGGRNFEADDGQYEDFRAPSDVPRMLGSGEGLVKWYNPSKGFGFIAQGDGADVYVHRTALQRSGIEHVNEGDKVAYNLVEYRGRVQAGDIRVLEHAPESAPRDRGGGGGGAQPAFVDDAEHRGTVKFYNGEKGFGFVQPDDGSADIFFHVSGLLVRDPILQSGEVVTFRLANHRGRINAVDVDRA